MRTLAFLAVIFASSLALGQPAELPPLYPAAKTYQPTPVPDRVILTWTGDPATTQAVTWRTDTSVTAGIGELAESEVGPSFDPISGGKPNAEKVRAVPAKTQLLKSDLSEAHYHSVEFADLKPKTKYVYRVGDGRNWSEWYQFETASTQPEPFGFIYFGDAQNDLKRHWSRVIRGAYSDMPKAKFIIHAGDLVNNGPRDAEWGEWHAAGGWINGMVPSFATPGNHEYSGRATRPMTESLTGIAATAQEKRPAPKITEHWRATFAYPTNGPAGLEETAFHMDYQGVRFISLNSNEKIPEQTPWLEGLLQNNPCRWTVLTFHHPVYSPAKNRDNKTLREAWRPIIDKYGVDLVLTGHDHTYGRSGLMREDSEISPNRSRSERGTVYVVSVSGPKMYKLTDANWMKVKVEDTQLYQLIHIDRDTLKFEARTARGELFDQFELRKQGDGKNEIVERAQLESERPTQPRPSREQLLYAIGAMVVLALGYAATKAIRRKPRSA